MIFVEKYSPKTLDDMVLPNDLRNTFKNYVKNDDLPHLLLSSRVPGTGKSSLSKVLINETKSEALFLNASLYPNIDTLRDRIKNFVMTKSFNGKKKLVILDESDNLNPNSTQPALRGFIEEFQKNARFILTCNYPDKIIEPIRNRLIHIDFDTIFKEDKKELVKQIYMKLKDISEKEKINADKEVLLQIIKNNYPSVRGCINDLQRFKNTGNFKKNDNLEKFYDIIREADFEELKSLASGIEDYVLFDTAYKELGTIDDVILQLHIAKTIAEYSYKSEFVRDREINSLGFLAELKEILKER